LPNLANYSPSGMPLEQHQKIEKKKRKINNNKFIYMYNSTETMSHELKQTIFEKKRIEM
jgi:hypothetical protein